MTKETVTSRELRNLGQTWRLCPTRTSCSCGEGRRGEAEKLIFFSGVCFQENELVRDRSVSVFLFVCLSVLVFSSVCLYVCVYFNLFFSQKI